MSPNVVKSFVQFNQESFSTYNWNYSITTDMMQDSFKMQEVQSEKTGKDLIFFAITDTDRAYSKHDYDGIIGLGVDVQSTCTMDQLEFLKLIKDKSFSIYINSDKA